MYIVVPPSVNGLIEEQEGSVEFAAARGSNPYKFKYYQIVESVLYFDQSVTDPASIIQGDVNGLAIQKIVENTHRYLCKQQDGVMKIAQLDDSNSNYYADGSDADLTGGEGEVFVKFPKFYYKAELYSGNNYFVHFAYPSKPDGTYKEWDGNTLISAYRASEVDGVLKSVSGASVKHDNAFEFLPLIEERGEEFSALRFKHFSIIAFLYFAKYGNTDSQSVIGSGNATDLVSGRTDSLGMLDTGAEVIVFANHINLFGLEDWWGYHNALISNISYNNGYMDIVENGETRTVEISTSTATSLYINELVIGEELDAACLSNTGSSSTGYCDMFHFDSSSSSGMGFIHSAQTESGGIVGHRLGANNSITETRLVYEGTIEEINADEFKQITI